MSALPIVIASSGENDSPPTTLPKYLSRDRFLGSLSSFYPLDSKIVRLIANILLLRNIPKLRSLEFQLGFEQRDGDGGVYGGVRYERGGSSSRVRIHALLLQQSCNQKRTRGLGSDEGTTAGTRISFGVDRDVGGLFYGGRLGELLGGNAGVGVGKGGGRGDGNGDGGGYIWAGKTAALLGLREP